MNMIQGKGTTGSKSKKIELESAFVRLFTDLKNGKLEDTLSRLSLDEAAKVELRGS